MLIPPTRSNRTRTSNRSIRQIRTTMPARTGKTPRKNHIFDQNQRTQCRSRAIRSVIRTKRRPRLNPDQQAQGKATRSKKKGILGKGKAKAVTLRVSGDNGVLLSGSAIAHLWSLLSFSDGTLPPLLPLDAKLHSAPQTTNECRGKPELKRMCVCVCVCTRERERERIKKGKNRVWGRNCEKGEIFPFSFWFAPLLFPLSSWEVLQEGHRLHHLPKIPHQGFN